MTTSIALYLIVLLALCVERLYELRLSRRNARRAIAAGAVETGRGHFRAMAIVHALFPISCAVEVIVFDRPFPGAWGVMALIMALLAQGLRWWAVATLGRHWNVRILVLPGGQAITAGPYRFMRHPNYLAVVVEMAAIPLIHGAWTTAILFSLGNALLLGVRIPAEERALGPFWEQAFMRRSHRASPRGGHEAR
jgi:methyltransferase